MPWVILDRCNFYRFMIVINSFLNKPYFTLLINITMIQAGLF